MAWQPQESNDPLMYFILLESLSEVERALEAGTLCCMSEDDYIQQVAEDHVSSHSLEVSVIGEAGTVRVDVNALQPLDRKKAALLLAVQSSTERLGCFLERGTLEQALHAVVGQEVLVDHKQKLYPALLRYVGNILDSSALLPPVYFGVELEGEGEGLGVSDGTCRGVTFFKCKKSSGLFVSFNKILFSGSFPSRAGPAGGNPADHPHSLKPGEKMVQRSVCSDGFSEDFLELLTDSGLRDTLLLPLGSALKEKTFCEEGDSADDITRNGDTTWSPLEINSMVQIQYKKGEVTHGIIRWIGHIPNMEGRMAGVELDEDKGCTDGTLQSQRFFRCPPKRGIFVKLKACRPDTRFLVSRDAPPQSLEHRTQDEGGVGFTVVQKVPPLLGSAAVDVLCGKMRGIQGHCNSCYMDAALFSLFSCSSVLDSLLYKPALPVADAHIQRILREEIVNPLRKSGFVPARSVMMLRQQLMEESQCPSFTTSEKDPEEFLNLIMHRILAMEPLLKLKCEGQKVQDCYCYQIFIEKHPEVTVPTVQQLLESSFHHSNLKLAEIPSCFIIQTPRFGKEYKMFNKIIPSLELDITDLLQDSPRECVVCGHLATQECAQCFNNHVLSDSGFKQYCDLCAKQVPTHGTRAL
uniref:ubiquitinyl hydrolase 1 n=1 Tax=Leptobrachium leishanense TaxID=445787 RepID=A0A8C5PK18_9ANUR